MMTRLPPPLPCRYLITSSRVVGNKRQALALYFYVRIWCLFFISRCRGISDQGLCLTSLLAKRMLLRSFDFRRIVRPNTFFNQKSALCGRILFASTEVMQHVDLTCLYVLILRTYTKFVQKYEMLALGVCFPQHCLSDGRRFAASRFFLLLFLLCGHTASPPSTAGTHTNAVQ